MHISSQKGYSVVELIGVIGLGGSILLIIGLVISLIIFLVSNS